MITKCKGLTLVEIIVVIFIIAVMVSTLTITLGDNQAERLHKKSVQLAALIGLAQEQAIFNSEELGLTFSKDSYAFNRLVKKDEDTLIWETVNDDRVLRERTLPEGLQYSLYLEGIKVNFEKKKDKDEEDDPHVFILSDGSITPFRIDIGDNIEHSLSLSYKENGKYEIN